MIEVKECSKAFGTVKAVNKATLDVGVREVFGLVGSNGAGKSTLLRMMAGIIRPDEGEIQIDGMPVYENERGTYIFNSKDLNMIEYIDQILDAGIDSLKIEGRMKTALYVATVARTYRKAIDDCKESVEKYRANMDYYKEEIAKCTYRQFTTGFYFGKTDETSQIYDSNTYIKNCTYIGIVQGHNDKGYALLEQKNKFSVGETIEVMIPDGTNKEVIVKAIEDEDGRPMESAPHPKQMIYVDFGEEIKEGYLLRRREEVEEEN